MHLLFSCIRRLVQPPLSFMSCTWYASLHASRHTYTNDQCMYPHSECTSMPPVHILRVYMHANPHTVRTLGVYMHARLHTCTNHVQCILALLFFVIIRYYYSLLLFIVTRYIYSVLLLTLFIITMHYYSLACLVHDSLYTSMQPIHILRVYMHANLQMMMMPFNWYMYAHSECTRMHACMPARIMYNAYSLALLSSRSHSRD